jgi:polar amino acid transport system substrate-binding protein
MRLAVLTSLLTALLALLPAAAARAGEVWVVACDDAFPPYDYLEDGRLVGLDVELVEAIVRKAGAEPRFEPSSWNRVRDRLDRGDIEAAFQFVGNPERFEKYHMIGPFRFGRTVFATQRGATVRYDSYEDLRQYLIGTVRGFTYGRPFDTDPAIRKDDTAGDTRQLVRMLAADRVNLVIGDQKALAHAVRQEKLQVQLEFLPRAYDEVARYIAVPRNRPAVAARMTAAVRQLDGDGTLAAIQRRWD